MLFTFGYVSLPAASTSADKFDTFWHFLYLTGIASFVLVIGAAFLFVLKYRRKREDEATPYIPNNFIVEFISLFVTSVVVAVIFIWGWKDYEYFVTPKLDEYEINVIGQQWSWQIQYADGRSFTNEMFVPRGRPVHLIMAAKDVLHSFYIPAFRVKMDAVPGRFTSLRFTPTKAGVYDVFCAEYCGTSHSGMIGKVYVLEPEDFTKWQAGTWQKPPLPGMTVAAANAAGKSASMAEQGAVVFKAKTCNTCHSVDGSRLVGPTFKGAWGTQREMSDGSFVTMDENYFRESLMDPMKKVVKGYPPAMPVFRGQLTDEDINHLIAYMKALK